MVAIVDYQMGNLHSVQKACAQAGLKSKLVNSAAEIRRARAVILPGVGAFGQAMQHLTSRRLIKALKEAAVSGKPFLGICLGMQLLFDYSEEFGRHEGLGLLPGKVVPFSKKLKVPHMGWNQISVRQKSPFFRGVPDQAYMYFVHSFYCVPEDPQVVLTTTDYGKPFASAVGRGQLCGIQFHPEKSQDTGLTIYRNLAKMLARTR
ncbi:MAG: imidazole glycerol phosphate synthase subunit HisH [Candidatus Firestonebacteria bacterium]|nr:imidazole glycerol phosphate synthase subunit HisH [Candidatus Firestonebacteria bacterium]